MRGLTTCFLHPPCIAFFGPLPVAFFRLATIGARTALATAREAAAGEAGEVAAARFLFLMAAWAVAGEHVCTDGARGAAAMGRGS
jgi:hypothetical protein